MSFIISSCVFVRLLSWWLVGPFCADSRSFACFLFLWNSCGSLGHIDQGVDRCLSLLQSLFSTSWREQELSSGFCRVVMDLKSAMAENYKTSMEVYQGVAPFDDEAELIKEVRTRVLQECGVWCSTQPLATVAVMVLQAKVLYNMPGADTSNITVHSLVPCREKRNLGTFKSKDVDEKQPLSRAAGMEVLPLHRSIWSEEVPLNDSLTNLPRSDLGFRRCSVAIQRVDGLNATAHGVAVSRARLLNQETTKKGAETAIRGHSVCVV